MSRFVVVVATVALATVTFGCSSDSEEPGDAPSGPEPVTFTADIHPILQLKCGSSGCHDGDLAPTLPGHGAVDVEEAYDATQAIGGIAGEPVFQRIVTRISTDDPDFMMPPSYASPPCSGVVGAPGCITEAELALIQEWVAQGTPR